jgi:hypothetical protein
MVGACRGEEVEDELGSAGRGKSVVVAELVLKLVEVTVEEAGGVGALKGGEGAGR